MPPIPAYLLPADARTIAASLPGMAALLALDDSTLGALLLGATLDLDGAMPYQGRKYDPTQALEFPRVAYGPPAQSFSAFLATGAPYTPDTIIWDWDPDALVPFVPYVVQVACLYQVAWLLDPSNSERLEAIRSGLAAQTMGPASETYVSPAVLAALGLLSGLSSRVAQLMQRYRLKTGSLL